MFFEYDIYMDQNQESLDALYCLKKGFCARGKLDISDYDKTCIQRGLERGLFTSADVQAAWTSFY
jgi:hypothetical protein